MPTFARVAAKALVLLAGWLDRVGCRPLAAVAAVAQLRRQRLSAGARGGRRSATCSTPALTIALAAAAAALTDHPSTAAIVTLSVTVGTWILNFVAAVQGGLWERAAGYTPTAMVAEFQHGLVRLDVVLVGAALVAAGPGARGDLDAPRRRRAAPRLRVARRSAAWPPRRSSRARSLTAELGPLGEPDELVPEAPTRRCSSAIREPLRIEAHLAAEDPRRVDLERQALVEAAARAADDRRCSYVANTSTGLFEQTSAALRRDLVRARRPARDEPRDHGRGRARDDLRARRRHAAARKTATTSSAAIRSRSPPKRRGRGVLRHLAGAGRGRRRVHAQEAGMKGLMRRWSMAIGLAAAALRAARRPRTSRSI